jgi:bifunctional non-homologous end joining protein LigD
MAAMTHPFVAVPKPDAKDARWADPKLVAEVQFTTWTRDGRVRHPSFKSDASRTSRQLRQ